MARKAIVMGATSGIGLEVAQILTSKGWEVGIAGRRQHLLQKIQSKNLNITATQCIDITRHDAAEALHTLIGKMGGIDLYVHCAGVGYQNPALDAEKEMLTVETNVVGFTRMITAVFHYFSSRPDAEGHIAVISSIAGTKGLGAAPSYSSTKRYETHYMECLSQLCTIRSISNIHLHDIRPGFVKTDILDDGNDYPCQLDVHAVAADIVRGIERDKRVITIDWRFRIITFLWSLIPRWLWVRMKIASRKYK